MTTDMSPIRVADLVFTSPWAILPEKHEAICALIEARLAAPAGEPSAFVWSEPESYRTDTGVQVIPVRGVMAKRMNLFAAISGGMSTEKIGKQIQDAVLDNSVRGILLDIDSPGGAVDGSFALAESVFQARGKKPIIAFADGVAASAAYLLASACDEIVLNEVGNAGSIGILMTHIDESGADKKKGLVRTTISAGSYKTIGDPHQPLDQKSIGYLQDRVDYIYGMFVDKVARNRGVTPKQALSMADGKVFIGQKALDVGLVDQIGERGDALSVTETHIRIANRFDPIRWGRTEAIKRGAIFNPLNLITERSII